MEVLHPICFRLFGVPCRLCGGDICIFLLIMYVSGCSWPFINCILFVHMMVCFVNISNILVIKFFRMFCELMFVNITNITCLFSVSRFSLSASKFWVENSYTTFKLVCCRKFVDLSCLRLRHAFTDGFGNAGGSDLRSSKTESNWCCRCGGRWILPLIPRPPRCDMVKIQIENLQPRKS